MAGKKGKFGGYRPVADRLMEKLVLRPDTHCVEFVGSINNKGYGSFSGGVDLPGVFYAHRAAYLIWNGPIPEGCEVDHRCNNPRCCNPQHLWAVPHKVNSRFSPKKTDLHFQLSKSTCPRGHPYDRVNKHGHRGCSVCENAQKRARRAAHAMQEMQ